jgi:2-oxoglutarate dehydrogenase E1 component
LQKFSYLKSINAEYIDELYALYLLDPTSIDPSWRYLFEGMELTPTSTETNSGPSQASLPAPAPTPAPVVDFGAEAHVAELIAAYRDMGSLLAQMDPLSAPPASHPRLELSRFGLSQGDLNRSFGAGRLIGLGAARLSEILQALRETYCGSIGVEFTHIQDLQERDWLQMKMESSHNREALDPETKKFILKRLTESETFERFLHTRYVAQKRFSVEGAEGLIPTLDCILEVGGELGAEEFVLGMAHRGRLNVLTHIFGKKPEYIFTEFEGQYTADTSLGEGDVKYHKGFSSDFTTRLGKNLHLSLASNPSHLEFVNPVIEGIARAKQFQRNDSQRTKVIPVTIHGDAAFAGQGVCYETLNLSQLDGYKTGGTIHIIINNQVGFTTSPNDARSTSYCTDLAKMLGVPIFHVNGDDPEALWYIAKLSVEYRQKFKKDVFIDLICYRKHGHNEGDEPSFTQPVLYKKIKNHPSPREVYAATLLKNHVVTQEAATQLIESVTSTLMAAQIKTKNEVPQPYVSVFEGYWKNLRRPQESDLFQTVDTAVSEKILKDLATRINTIPKSFHLHPKLARFFEARQKAVIEGKGIDWGNAEALAFTSLLAEQHPVRLSGQDAERGTFTHRHSVLNDFETGEKYVPFNHLQVKQAQYEVHNSHLSETGVLGFEFGYSLAEPNTLVIWEAQFGDFANSAQVIIDQFIATSESKWQRMTGLTLLLPHGFEGQGPEHSSARLERFLQLAGKNNMIICNFTSPAQIFHGLRRQLKWSFRKPMIIMSPKSLLRHPQAVSDLRELSDGKFHEILDDPGFENLKNAQSAQSVRKVLLCSGKIFYDLLTHRNAKKILDVAIIRLEQIYPWPAERFAEILKRYKNAKQLVWVQEEPRNMGAWSFVFQTLSAGQQSIEYIGRDLCAAPAVGSHKLHEQEQEEIIQKAFL